MVMILQFLEFDSFQHQSLSAFVFVMNKDSLSTRMFLFQKISRERWSGRIIARVGTVMNFYSDAKRPTSPLSPM